MCSAFVTVPGDRSGMMVHKTQYQQAVLGPQTTAERYNKILEKKYRVIRQTGHTAKSRQDAFYNGILEGYPRPGVLFYGTTTWPLASADAHVQKVHS
jgi:hypothetical protein